MGLCLEDSCNSHIVKAEPTFLFTIQKKIIFVWPEPYIVGFSLNTLVEGVQ